MLYTLLQTFLVHIPTVYISLYCIAALQGLYPERNRLLAFGTVGGGALTLFRHLPGPPGLHVPLAMIMLIVLSRQLTHGRWSLIVLGVLATLLLTGVGESLLALPLLGLRGLSVDTILANPFLTMTATWIGNLPLVAMSVYFYLRRRQEAQLR